MLMFDPDDMPEDSEDGSTYIERLNQLTEEAVEHIADTLREWIYLDLPEQAPFWDDSQDEEL